MTNRYQLAADILEGRITGPGGIARAIADACVECRVLGIDPATDGAVRSMTIRLASIVGVLSLQRG